MSQFRKRPVVINAMQLQWQTWGEMCDFAGVGRLTESKPEGCYIGTDGRPSRYYDGEPKPTEEIGLVIPTLEGLIVARQNDWVIRGIKNELYPCKPDIFEATYEEIRPDQPLPADYGETAE